MIILLHPRAASPRSRRFPLSVLSLAAVIDGREDYAIVDGNVDADPGGTLQRLQLQAAADLLAVSVMPGPQMVAAIPLCRSFREKWPSVPIVWGGYFPSLYPDAALNASYVDFVVRAQGEDTFVELIAALRGDSDYSRIRGLSYKDGAGRHIHNADRALRGPEEFPWYPYHRIDAPKYILPTFLGSHTAAHQTSIGCAFRCNFCGVASAYGSRQKAESPGRTVAILRYLKDRYAVNAIQFFDNNFFLNEDRTLELTEGLTPLGIRWWCEARIDAVLGYSDAILRALKRAGATMIYFGAESGSDWVLAQMNKQVESRQTLELAERIRHFGIVPEFSFLLGNPHDPERDARETISFIRRLKSVNPDAEIIVQHYVPTPQRERMYGDVDGMIQFPATPEEWASPRWYNYTLRKDPRLPWLRSRTKRRIDNFERVLNSRWPTIQDIRMPGWGRGLLRALSGWRYRLSFYAFPLELEWAQRIVRLRKPKVESL